MLIFKEFKAVMTVGIYVMDDTDPEVYTVKRECVYGFRPFDTPSSYENCLCFERNLFLCIGCSFILPQKKSANEIDLTGRAIAQTLQHEA